MSLNSLNFVSASQEVAVDLSILLSLYQQIEADDDSTYSNIEMLDEQFAEILGRMHEVVEFAGHSKQTVDMITESLNSGLLLTSRIMKEKTRIVKNSTALAEPSYQQNYFSLN